MPKTPSNKLFRLVHSLSGSEKRYFKLFAGKEEKNSKYLRLFDAIEAQEAFDEEALKQAVYGAAAIEGRKYSELKAYLYDLILKSLQGYDERSSIDFRLKGMLQSVRVLYKRSQFDDCKDLLAKTRKLARKYEQFNTLVEVLNWEKAIAYAQTDIAFLDRELPRIESEEQRALEHLQNIAAYRNIFLQLLTSLRKDASLRSAVQTSALRQILEHPLLSSEEKAGTHRARVLYHRIYSLYYFSQKDFGHFYRTSRRLLDLMESQPHFLQEDMSEYISALSNLTFSCGWLKKYGEVEECLRKFRKIRPNTLDDELKIHRQYYMNKLGFYIVKGDFEEGLRVLEEHQQEVRRFDDAAFRKNTFFFQYFYICFGSGDFSRALEYLNEWLNLSGNIERKDLQSLARILNLIVHFEMGNSMLLDSLVRSTYRFLKKQEHVREYERRVLNFIRNSQKWTSRKESRQAYQLLKEDLAGLFQSKEEGAMLELFDITAWIDSKIEDKPFAQVVQERFQAIASAEEA